MKCGSFAKIKRLFYKNRSKLNRDIIFYLQNKIVPSYRKNDKAHDLDHLHCVLKRSFSLAKQFGESLDYNIICILAVFHDSKYHISMENHEKLAGEVLQGDKFLAIYYSEQERFKIKKILVEHDSKVDNKAISIYAKILRTADCTDSLNVVLKRLYEFRKAYFSEMSTNEKIEDSYKYMRVLYGKNGLDINKHYFFEPKFDKMLKKAQFLISDKKQFVSLFKKINHIK